MYTSRLGRAGHTLPMRNIFGIPTYVSSHLARKEFEILIMHRHHSSSAHCSFTLPALHELDLNRTPTHLADLYHLRGTRITNTTRPSLQAVLDPRITTPSR